MNLILKVIFCVFKKCKQINIARAGHGAARLLVVTKTNLCFDIFISLKKNRILIFPFSLGAKHMPEDFFSNGANLLMHMFLKQIMLHFVLAPVNV